MKNELKTAFKMTLPVMAGYLVIGFGFGLIMSSNGYGVLWAAAMSLFIYAGSMQYVAISLLTSGASVLTTALTTLVVNARHLFYGVSMINRYRDTGKIKPYLIFSLTDETYSLVCMGQGPDNTDFKQYAFMVSLLNHIYWIAGTLLGSLAGEIITMNTAGVDFAMTALFITVFVEQWKSTKNHLPALTGVGLSAICLMLFGPDRFLIPAMILICMALIFGKKRMEKEEPNE